MKLKLVSDSYRELGKTVLNIGQSIIIVMLVALMLKERVSPLSGALGIAASFVCIVVGISFVQKAYHKLKLEENAT